MAIYNSSIPYEGRATSFARLPNALRTANFRLAALFAFLLIAAMLVLGGAMFLTMRSAFDQYRIDRVEAEFAFLEGEYRKEGLPELIDEVNERIRTAQVPMDYLVLGENGERLTGNMPEIPASFGWTEYDDATGEPLAGGNVRALLADLGGGVKLAVGDDMGPVGEVDRALGGVIVWLLLATLGIGLGGGLFASSRFLRRVDAIALAAEAITGGDIDRRMTVSGTNDDFDRVSTALNRMLDRIAALVVSLRQVSTDIAHDLRTPVTRLHQRLEGALAESASGSTVHASLEAAVAETNTILDTFSALLRIAQIESGTRRAGFRDVDLGTVFDTVAEAFEDAAAHEGKTLRREIEARVVIRGDRELLTQLVANLLDNAIRHTPAGTTIVLGLERTPRNIVAWVADNGLGVPSEELGMIFRRFYRLDRSRTTEGNGLGLSLVAAIADLHGFKVIAAQNHPGLAIRIEIPV